LPEYFRTIRSDVLPSEFLTRKVLAKNFNKFMASTKNSFPGKELIQTYQCHSHKSEKWQLDALLQL
jgi:hypothetical protein